MIPNTPAESITSASACHLPKLPAELRNAPSTSSSSSPALWTSNHQSLDIKPTQKPALLQMNCQVRFEGIAVYYRTNIFAYRVYTTKPVSYIEAWLQSIGAHQSAVRCILYVIHGLKITMWRAGPGSQWLLWIGEPWDKDVVSAIDLEFMSRAAQRIWSFRAI